MWIQKTITLAPKSRGFHLITGDVVRELPELAQLQVGLLNLTIQHTSASLTINENADPSVRADFEQYFTRAVPEDEPYYTHRDEGPDDLPAHIKASLLGASITVPITAGRLNLGIWQGIYLGEHRNRGGARKVVATIQGE